MNKIYQLLLAVSVLLSLSNANAQSYTSGDISVAVIPGASHDSNSCASTCAPMYLVTVSSSFTGDSVMFIDTNTHTLLMTATNTAGTNPWTFTFPMATYMYTTLLADDQLSGGAALFAGPVVKVRAHTDTIYGIANFYALPVSNPCVYSTVSGMAYIDNNSNCVYDGGDVPLNGLYVNSTAGLSSPTVSVNFRNTLTASTGLYHMNIQQSWMTGYTVSLPPAYYFIFPLTSCFSGAYSYTTLPQTGVDFPLQCSGSLDVQCWAGSPADVRVGTPFFMQPYVSNTGCDSVSGVLRFVKDSRVTYDASMSTNPATSVSGDTLIWNYTNLTNLTNGAYWNSFISHIYLAPDTSVHVGDTLCFRIYTAVPTSDIDPTNNDQTICLPVVYSYDPNLKEVSPTGTGTPGYIPAATPELTYTLHFQNTGTATAYNVQVVDTLDSHLDAISLKILGTSNTMDPEWLAPGVVRFNFNGIYLPDSTSNEPASHGFVRFSVKPHAGLAPGTQIKNRGSIYFDSNPPVVTNSVLNTIQASTTGTVPSVLNSVTVYPNPANDQVFIENLLDGKVSIMNINGSVVISREITSGKTSIDISNLPDGVYILQTISKDNTTTRKFIKQ